MQNSFLGDSEAEAAKEAGKAVQETAKTASKTLDLIRDAGKVFGPAAEELAALMGERMRYWRFLNINRINEKIQSMRNKQNISAESIKFLPFGNAFQVIDAASLEDDETVQELWARLLFNATKQGTDSIVKKVHIDLVKSLSSAEVVYLDLIYACESNAYFKSHNEIVAFNDKMNKKAEEGWRNLPREVCDTAIQNLIRLRCVTFRPKSIDASRLFQPIHLDSSRHVIYNVDPHVFENIITSIFDIVQIASGIKEPGPVTGIPLQTSLGASNSMRIEVPEMNFMLTALGKDVMRACSQSKPLEG